jgi:hypothetical protein
VKSLDGDSSSYHCAVTSAAPCVNGDTSSGIAARRMGTMSGSAPYWRHNCAIWAMTSTERLLSTSSRVSTSSVSGAA